MPAGKKKATTCSGRAGCGHHFTNGQCVAEWHQVQRPRWEDKCMAMNKRSGPASFTIFNTTAVKTTVNILYQLQKTLDREAYGSCSNMSYFLPYQHSSLNTQGCFFICCKLIVHFK